MIVLADQNCRQIPERRHVKRLEQLPLVRGTVTVESKRHVLVLGVLLRESQTTSERNLSPNNAVAAIEATVLLVEMHRTAFSPGAPVPAAHELGEDLREGPTAADEGAVIAVSGDDAVLLGDGGLHADGHGFLSVVQVAEPADQLGLVERVRGDLHAAHRRHVAEEGEELLGRGVDGARRRLAVVGGEGDRGLDGERRGIVGRRGGDRTAGSLAPR